MTAELTIIVKPTPAICQECVDQSRHQNEAVGIVWCPHHMSGGIYIVEQSMWTVRGPYPSEADFKRSVLAAFTPRAKQGIQ